MKPKPDNRNDNVESIQFNIKKAEENIKRANDMRSVTSDQKTKQILEEKNKRRENAIDSMRAELEDETGDKNNHYR